MESLIQQETLSASLVGKQIDIDTLADLVAKKILNLNKTFLVLVL